MKRFTAVSFFCLYLLAGLSSLQATTYYLSPSGNDANAGTTPDQAWASIDKINETRFYPGDSILFQEGNTFRGTIELDAEDAGTAGEPLVVSSFGTGRATINSGDYWDLYAYNAAGITMDIMGRVLVNRKYPLHKGTNAISLPVSISLPTGIYLLKAIIGEEAHQLKLIKQ